METKHNVLRRHNMTCAGMYNTICSGYNPIAPNICLYLDLKTEVGLAYTQKHSFSKLNMKNITYKNKKNVNSYIINQLHPIKHTFHF